VSSCHEGVLASGGITSSFLTSTRDAGGWSNASLAVDKEGRSERTNKTERKTEEVTSDGWVATREAQKIEGNSLVLLQVNCRSILNKSLWIFGL
jgi:hypothetical protein